LDTSVGRAKFLRQLYNLRHVLERNKEAGDTEAKIQQLQNKIDQYDKKYYFMKSFYSKDSQGTNSQDVPSTTDCAEIRAHGYEVKPEAGEIVDESGKYVLKPLYKVWQPLSTYTPR
jgi:hypothetical protein